MMVNRRRHLLPWWLNPWPHVPKLFAEREQARRIAEQLAAELDVTQEATSMLLTEFGEVCAELAKRDRQRATNRANRLAGTVARKVQRDVTTAALKSGNRKSTAANDQPSGPTGKESKHEPQEDLERPRRVRRASGIH